MLREILISFIKFQKIDDPERMVGKSHPSHRGYFQNYASLKEIGQIKDPEVLKTIHWNIRLLYLRDCVLAHYLDERILQFLSAVKKFF